jgi:hypothetical protein
MNNIIVIVVGAVSMWIEKVWRDFSLPVGASDETVCRGGKTGNGFTLRYC